MSSAFWPIREPTWTGRDPRRAVEALAALAERRADRAIRGRAAPFSEWGGGRVRPARAALCGRCSGRRTGLAGGALRRMVLDARSARCRLAATAGLDDRKAPGARIDSAAAAVVLQSWLDAQPDGFCVRVTKGVPTVRRRRSKYVSPTPSRGPRAAVRAARRSPNASVRRRHARRFGAAGRAHGSASRSCSRSGQSVASSPWARSFGPDRGCGRRVALELEQGIDPSGARRAPLRFPCEGLVTSPGSSGGTSGFRSSLPDPGRAPAARRSRAPRARSAPRAQPRATERARERARRF